MPKGKLYIKMYIGMYEYRSNEHFYQTMGSTHYIHLLFSTTITIKVKLQSQYPKYYNSVP